MALFIISSLIPGDRQFVTSILTLRLRCGGLEYGAANLTPMFSAARTSAASFPWNTICSRRLRTSTDRSSCRISSSLKNGGCSAPPLARNLFSWCSDLKSWKDRGLPRSKAAGDRLGPLPGRFRKNSARPAPSQGVARGDAFSRHLTSGPSALWLETLILPSTNGN